MNVALGINYYHKGVLDVALKYYIKGIGLAEEQERVKETNPLGLASLYYNVASVFSGKGMHQLRKDYLQKGLQLVRDKNNQLLEGRLLNGLGGVLLEERQFDEALDLLFKARDLAALQQDDTGLASVVNNIGLALVDAGRHQEAIGFLLESLAIKQQSGNKEAIASSYLHLGICSNKCGSATEAIDFLQCAIELANEIGAENTLADCYNNIAQSYAAIGQYDVAYNYQLQHDKIKDALFSNAKANAISEAISTFELKRSAREAELLQSKMKSVKVLTERLERANRELLQFTNLVAQDFKEPLRMIKGYIQLIKKRLNENLEVGESSLIEAAEAGATQMEQLLSSLMELSKLNGKPELVQVDLNKTIEQVLLNASELLLEQNAVVSAAVLPTIQADAIQMAQLFQNLICNAVKYNNSEQPLVKLSAAYKPGVVVITVEDNGIGIPESEREKVFQLFQRLHSRYEYNGSGVGLSICRKIVEGMNGSIRITDSVLGGAAFVVELPA